MEVTSKVPILSLTNGLRCEATEVLWDAAGSALHHGTHTTEAVFVQFVGPWFWCVTYVMPLVSMENIGVPSIQNSEIRISIFLIASQK